MLSEAAVNRVLSSLDGGYLRIFEAKTVLAELRFSTPAFAGLKARPLKPDTSARNTGKPERYEAVALDGTVILTGNKDQLNLDKPEIERGGTVFVDEFIVTRQQ